MGSWNNAPMEILYNGFGWIGFFSWALSLYPQIILNYRRKSVVGLNFDFVVLNFTKHTSYLIYNASMFFSPVIHKQYHEKYGPDELIPVAANDVAFSIHSVLLIAFTLFQITIYDRGTQKVSKPCMGIVSVACATAFACLIIACPKHSWLWLVSVFSTIQVVMTAIKYAPQAPECEAKEAKCGATILEAARRRWVVVLEEARRRWAGRQGVGTDLEGAAKSEAARVLVRFFDSGSWVNFYGNIGKALLSLETIVFDLIFFVQHYVLYRAEGEVVNRTIFQETTEPLVKPAADASQWSNVLGI